MTPSLTVAFNAVPLAHWGPLFQVFSFERPDVQLAWRPVDFPTNGASILRDADVGLFLEPPVESGLNAMTLETHPMMVLMAAGHPLTRGGELTVGDVLDEPFPGGPDMHTEWRAFWTLDRFRGEPPRLAPGEVRNPEDGLRLVASGEAIATISGPVSNGLSHPGIVSIPLTDGPLVSTRLVWRSDDDNPDVQLLVELAAEMAQDSDRR
jgi:DNA-binding transcriptional LysR family regulator